MMSIADANSVITATAHDDGKIQLPELSKPLKVCLNLEGKKGQEAGEKREFNNNF